MRVTVGIVLFNPDLLQLQSNIEVLKKQFESIILFDNTEYKDVDSKEVFSAYENVIYLSENKNLGIAYALNRIMEKAQKLNAEWVITFDQDSKVPSNLLSEYSKYLQNDRAGILCPQVIDKRRKYMKLEKNGEKCEIVAKCITSASCTSVKAWEDAGKYDELLFIDLVDNDFSKRVRYAGYEIYRINDVVLEQEYGVIEYKDTKLARFFVWLGEKLHNKNIAKLSYKKQVSPVRVYYTNRNVIYLNKKHKQYGGIGYESYYCKSFVEYYVSFNLASILRGSKKIQILKAVIKGTIDGIKISRLAEPYKFK